MGNLIGCDNFCAEKRSDPNGSYEALKNSIKNSRKRAYSDNNDILVYIADEQRSLSILSIREKKFVSIYQDISNESILS